MNLCVKSIFNFSVFTLIEGYLTLGSRNCGWENGEICLAKSKVCDILANESRFCHLDNYRY